MTWFQPPGYVHIMVKDTWAEQVLATTGATFPFAAQRTADGAALVLRAVNPSASAQLFTLALAGGAGGAAGPALSTWTLGGEGFSPTDDNTPGAPAAVSPVLAQVPVAAGARSFNFTLPPRSFMVVRVPLAQGA